MKLVYQLYRLTDEEIAIVEGHVPADAAIAPPCGKWPPFRRAIRPEESRRRTGGFWG